MIQSGLKKIAMAFGPETVVSWVRWAPSGSATQTLTEAHGVRSVTRTGSLAELVALANELRTDYAAHLAQKIHAANDSTNTIATADATDEPTAITLANAIKSKYEAHRTQTGVHANNDSTNTIAAANATDTTSLYTLLNELKTDYNLHLAQSTVHVVNDGKNTISSANASTTPSAVTLANELKTDFNLHLSQLVHKVADTTNVLTSAACTNLATAIVLLNDLRTQYAAHRVSTTHHDNADSTNTVASSACTDRATAVTLANQLKTAFNAHLTQSTRHPTNDTVNSTAAVLNTTGAYSINLRRKGGALFPIVSYVENDTTHYHFVDVPSDSAIDGAVDVRHRSVAFASVASGPSASDTVDELQALIFQPKNRALRSGAKSKLKSFGPKCEIAYARWVPSSNATQTLTEAQGITSITRSGAGVYTVNMKSSCKAVLALISYVENDTTHYHVAEVTATAAASKTVSIKHRSVAYASVASGPTASDTVDQLEVLILRRLST